MQNPHFPDQPDYLRISKEDSCNTLMVMEKGDPLTYDHPKCEQDIGDTYANIAVKRVP